MGMEMCRYGWKEHNGNGYHHHQLQVSDYDENMVPNREGEHSQSSTVISSSSSPSSSSSSSYPPSPTLGYIEHPISKLDTLAGIAIKYGLEVADIKKMNGLVTDHQMFALKTLRIPPHGRHPPSPCLSNGSSTKGHGNSDHNLPDHEYRELFESFLSPRMKSSEQKVSPSMSSGYYGAKPTMKKSMSVFEMAMYRKGAANSSENGSFSRDLPMPDRPLSHHHKSRSLASGILDDILERSDVAEAGEGESDKWNDILLQRHQKSEANIKDTPELLLAQENSSNGGFLSRTRKSLALRQKSGSRTALTTDSEPRGINPMLIRLGKAFLFDEPSGVRKSSSTSCLQDKDNSGNSSIWPAFSATGIAKPIFDGLAKPITGRRNKAALD